MISSIKKRPSILFLYAVIFSFTFVAAECDDILNTIIQGDVVGTWQLVRQEGSGQDVCENEIVDFQSDGTAILQCPGENAITRQYTANGNVLEFTATGVQYSIQTATSTELVLDGINVSRNLQYTRIGNDNSVKNVKPTGVNKNSSEN